MDSNQWVFPITEFGSTGRIEISTIKHLMSSSILTAYNQAHLYSNFMPRRYKLYTETESSMQFICEHLYHIYNNVISLAPYETCYIHPVSRSSNPKDIIAGIDLAYMIAEYDKNKINYTDSIGYQLLNVRTNYRRSFLYKLDNAILAKIAIYFLIGKPCYQCNYLVYGKLCYCCGAIQPYLIDDINVFSILLDFINKLPPDTVENIATRHKLQQDTKYKLKLAILSGINTQIPLGKYLDSINID
ncbi:MAG: hypothetical protein WBK76_00560 [Candidatus Saccharimonadales bacterium]